MQTVSKLFWLTLRHPSDVCYKGVISTPYHGSADQTIVRDLSTSSNMNHGTMPNTRAPATPMLTAASSPAPGLIGSAYRPTRRT